MDRKMKTLIRSVVKSNLPYMLKMSEEVTLSFSCKSSFMRFVQDLMKMKVWTFSLLDSIGKPPSGLLKGTLWMQGDYDQCLDIETMENKVVRGKFCSVLMKLPKLQQDTIQRVSSSDITIVQLLKNLFKPASISQFLSKLNTLRLDVCIPNSCSENDLENIGKWLIRKFIKVEVEFCKTKEEKKEYSISQLICLAVFSSLIICIILTTTVDALLKLHIVSKKMVNGKIFDIVVSLSALSTGSKLFSSNIYEETKALSGIKILVIFWVIFGHIVTSFDLIPTVLEKYLNLFGLWNHIPMEIASNSFVLIESFFVISGFLTFYTRKQKANSKMQYVQFVINRAIRLTLPVLCVVATMIILPLSGDGPHWEYTKREAEFAERHWWAFAIHIQTYMGYPYNFLNHLWFMSNLMQLTIITAPLLFVCDRWPKHGLLLIFMLVIVGIASYVTNTLMSDIFPFFGYSVDREKFYSYVHNNYQRPYYSHLSSYCTGLLIGIILSNKVELKIKKIYRVIFWIISLSLLMCSTFGLHKQITEVSPNKSLILIHRALSPFIWIIGLSWICVACITGYGGVVNRFLSMKVFTILDRLNIWIYVLHPLVILYIYAQLRKGAMMTELNMWMLFTLVLFLSVIVSFFYYIFIQAPLDFLALKLLRSNSKKRASVKNCQLTTISMRL
ncbi:nose resistant to fluoxetine protein 6-like [Centruroides sculpturatus]|uniref:nose resistant to fluoxetine protein 6-like n=1 Tax=Centruroides sculpturatus TaxID=218467 RepID=UPI000C6DD49A|nr:nose resistant to fluoxetine protein 6-like [Centruroides sculpturatus]